MVLTGNLKNILAICHYASLFNILCSHAILSFNKWPWGSSALQLSQNETFSWELLSLQYLTEQVSRIDMALQTNTAALRSFRGINDNKTNSSLGADKIHLLYGQRCFCSNCLLLSPNVCFSFSRSVLSGVMALTEAASASKERGQGEWVPPVCPHRLQSPNHILPAN